METPSKLNAVEELVRETSFEDLEKDMREAYRHMLSDKLALPHAYLQDYHLTLEQVLAALRQVMTESENSK